VVPAAPLYVFGAGHVSFHVARLGSSLGFDVHVVDDRERFANRERFPDARDVVVDDIAGWCATHPLPRGAYALVVTRGHRHDLECLRALVSQDLQYLGLIGSKAKVARLYERLREDGVPALHLQRVHAPVGLDIGAVTPEEIAVAIAAEMIAVRRGKLQADGSESAVRSLRWEPPALAATAES
jgi:xanthine dehydrogenase accessory factor